MRYAVFAFFAVTACAPASVPEFSEEQREEVAEAIQLRIDGYCEAVLSRDVEYLNGFWADVEGFTFAGDGEIMTEHRLISDATAAWFDAISEVLYCEMSDTRIYVLSPTAASATTAFAWGIVTAAGDTVESYGGWTYVFDQLDGEYRTVHSAGYREFK